MSVYGAVYGDVYGDVYGVVVAPPPVPVPGGFTFRVAPPDSLFSSRGRMWLLLDPYIGLAHWSDLVPPLVCRAMLTEYSPVARLEDVGPTATIQDCGS